MKGKRIARFAGRTAGNTRVSSTTSSSSTEAWRSSCVRIQDASDLSALTERWISMLRSTMGYSNETFITRSNHCVTSLFLVVCIFEKSSYCTRQLNIHKITITSFPSSLNFPSLEIITPRFFFSYKSSSESHSVVDQKNDFI